MPTENKPTTPQRNKPKSNAPGSLLHHFSGSNTPSSNNENIIEKQININIQRKEKINIAILIGISDYGSSTVNLPQCENDVSLASEIISKLKKPSYILSISGKSSGQEATDKIINFFRELKEKEEKVDELIFYFTGHGLAHETNGGEIESRLVFSDYSPSRINQTTIPSGFIDELSRSLSPETYVKIIDSCYSGSKLIKGNIEQREKFLSELSKDKNHYTEAGFNNVYVMASSRSDQVSFANSKFSDFSESLFFSLCDLPDDVKYRHVVNRLADDFSTKEQRPIFVTQGSLDEGFGVIPKELREFIYEKLTSDASNTTESIKNKSDETDALLKDLAEKIKEKTATKLFSKDYFHNFLNIVHEKTNSLIDALSPFYEAVIDPSEKQILPNEKVIGEWIKNNNHSYFVRVRYKKIETESKGAIAGRLWARGLSGMDNYGKEPEETKINSEQSVIGFIPIGMDDNVEAKNSRIREIRLTPKEEMKILDSILIHIAIINSQERIALFSSIEACPLIDWDRYSGPKCPSWKIHEIKSAMKPDDISQELDSIFENMKIVSIALIKSKSIDQEKNIQEN